MQLQKTKSGANVGISAGKLKWDTLQYRKKSLQHDIDMKSKQIYQLYNISSGIKDIKDKENHENTFANIQWRIRIAETEAKKLKQDMEKVLGEEGEMLQKNPETTSADSNSGVYTDFYEWLSTIFDSPKEKIHFFLSLFPAFFFDVISPVAMALFLFLRKQ